MQVVPIALARETYRKHRQLLNSTVSGIAGGAQPFSEYNDAHPRGLASSAGILSTSPATNYRNDTGYERSTAY